MEAATREWEDARLDRRVPVAVIALDLPMGYLYAAERPLTDAELTTIGKLFSATVKYAGTVKFSGGRRPLGNLGRLVSVSAAAESAQPFDSNILGAAGRVVRRTVTVELAAGADPSLTSLVGDHHVLGRTLYYLSSFPGLDLSKALTISRTTVKRLLLTSSRLRIEGA